MYYCSSNTFLALTLVLVILYVGNKYLRKCVYATSKGLNISKRKTKQKKNTKIVCKRNNFVPECNELHILR